MLFRSETVDLDVEATTTQSNVMESEIVTASFQLQSLSAEPPKHQPSLDQSNNISYLNAQLSHIISQGMQAFIGSQRSEQFWHD